MTVWIYVTSSRGYNTSLSRLPRPRSRAVNFFKHGAAALADRGIVLVLAHMCRVVPAALALGAIGFLDLDMHVARAVTLALLQADGPHDQPVAPLRVLASQQRVQRIGSST